MSSVPSGAGPPTVFSGRSVIASNRRRHDEKTELLNVPEKPNAQIACDLTDAPDTPDERIAEYGRLFQRALAGRERTADAVELTGSPRSPVSPSGSPTSREREGACCPFMSHHVARRHARHLASGSQAGPAAQATLDEFHAFPERFGDGFKGLLERLAARGFTSGLSRAPVRFAVDEGQRKPGVLDKLKAACGC